MPTPVITSVTPVVHAGSKSKLVILGSDLPKNVRLVLVEPDDAEVEISEPRWFSSSKVIFRLSSRLSSAEPQTLNFQLFSDGGCLPTAIGEDAFAVRVIPHPAVEKYRGSRVLPWKLFGTLVSMILLAWLLSRPRTVEISASPAQIAAGQISEVMVEFSRPVDLENRHWFKLPADVWIWDKTILAPTQVLLKIKTAEACSGQRVFQLQGLNGSFVLTVGSR